MMSLGKLKIELIVRKEEEQAYPIVDRDNKKVKAKKIRGKANLNKRHLSLKKMIDC